MLLYSKLSNNKKNVLISRIKYEDFFNVDLRKLTYVITRLPIITYTFYGWRAYWKESLYFPKT